MKSFCDLSYPIVSYITNTLGKDATIIHYDSARTKVSFSVFWQKASAHITLEPETMHVSYTHECMAYAIYDHNRAVSSHKLKRVLLNFPEWKKLPLAFCMEGLSSNTDTLGCLIFSNGGTNLKRLMTLNPKYNLKILSDGATACSVLAGMNYKEVTSYGTA